MRSYTFRYRHGQSAPFATLNATDDDDFFKTVRPLWEQETGFKHIDDTVVCATTEYRKVPEPASDTQAVRDAFFDHKLAHAGEPPVPLTPLQERMQSGGPGERV